MVQFCCHRPTTTTKLMNAQTCAQTNYWEKTKTCPICVHDFANQYNTPIERLSKKCGAFVMDVSFTLSNVRLALTVHRETMQNKWIGHFVDIRRSVLLYWAEGIVSGRSVHPCILVNWVTNHYCCLLAECNVTPRKAYFIFKSKRSEHVVCPTYNFSDTPHRTTYA